MKKTALLPILILLTAAVVVVVILNYKTPKEGTQKQTAANTATSKETKNTQRSSANSPLLTTSPVVNADINLIITSPAAAATVSESSVTVKGTVNPRAHVIINEYDLTPGKDGSFEQLITLDEGENYISVVAYDDDGNSSERELLIVRTVEET